LSDPRFAVDPDDLELLRDEDLPNAETRARVRARLAGVIPMGALATSGTREASAPPRGPVAAAPAPAFALGRAVAAIAFVMGTITGAALYAVLIKPLAPRIVYVDRPITTPVIPPSAPVPVAEPADLTSSPPPSAVHSPAHPSARAPASQLSAERILLDQARTSLMQGDAMRALGFLDRHRRAFASPLLAEERDALEVQSLVKAGRFDEARARAAAFHRQAPGSLFASVVDAAIESIP